MKIYLQFPTNTKIFDLFVENKEYILWWNSKSEKEIAWFFLKNFPWEVMNELSPQYETNFVAIRKLKKLDKDIFNKIEWIYYGSDNCEYLAPTLQEVEHVFEWFYSIKNKYNIEGGFTLVTPYVWQKMLNERIKPVLDFLNSRKVKQQIEVVFNDLWTLMYLKKACPNLKPIAWRLVNKLLKTPLIDTYWNRAHVPGELMKNKKPKEIEKIQKQIVEYQNKFYNSSEISFKPFLKFLSKHNIERATLDFMWNRDTLYKEYEVGVDLHFPYSLVFTWRLCDTSAIEQPERWNYAIDDICPRTCFRYDIFYKIKTVWYQLIQRWNAWYRVEIDIDKVNKEFLENSKNRLVFSPFI